MTIQRQPSIQFFVRSLPELPTRSLADGWKYASVYDGFCCGFSKLSIHVSWLKAGVLPHEVHSHHDEEIFLLLSGSLEVIKGNHDQEELPINPIIEEKGFVYHSRKYEHTLRAIGTSDAHYLVVRWKRNHHLKNNISPFCVTLSHPEPFPDSSTGVQIQPIEPLQNKTNNRISAHYSRLLPGAGYEPHKDLHDVLIILFEGTVETIGKNVTAPAVAFFASGFPHGLKNSENIPANYIVFEMED
jgi:mannose-6-phosphate isomerase-like protein (cupin superfamily)